MRINNYLSIAQDEFKYLERSMKTNRDYSPSINAVQCQQVCEKYLKFVVETLCQEHLDSKRALRTHDLVLIYHVLVDCGIDLHLDDNKLAMVKDYYFTARYPGDYFRNVSFEKAEEAFILTEQVKREIESLVEKKGYCPYCGSKLLSTGICTNLQCERNGG